VLCVCWRSRRLVGTRAKTTLRSCFSLVLNIGRWPRSSGCARRVTRLSKVRPRVVAENPLRKCLSRLNSFRMRTL
jgi:hypothetical protein